MSDTTTVMAARLLSAEEFARLTAVQLREAFDNSDGIRVARLENGRLTVVDATTMDVQWACGDIEIGLTETI